MSYQRPEDLPYGPGQPDYEYDTWRQRHDEEEHAAELLKQQHANEEKSE